MSAEASILCNAIAWCDAEATYEALLAPLLAALSRDVAAVAKSSTRRLSKVGRTYGASLCFWSLGLLLSALIILESSYWRVHTGEGLLLAC